MAVVATCAPAASAAAATQSPTTAPLSATTPAPLSTSGAPVVAVSPDAGLLEGQLVTVTGADFSPDSFIGVVECQVGATDAGGCDLSTEAGATADGTGSWSVTFNVRRALQLGSSITDCVPEGCAIGAANLSDIAGESASAPLHFANVPPPPRPTLTVFPNTDLLHRQVVEVSGSGWLPDQLVTLSQCVQETNQCNTNSDSLFADDSGGFATTFIVQRLVGLPGGPPIDCLSTLCLLEGQSIDDPLVQNAVALQFADVALPDRPVLTVIPGHGLGARQVVTVSGRGYGPDESLSVDECTRTSTFETFTCNFFPEGVMTDLTGSFSTTVTVRRFIPGYPQPVDCAPSACVIATYSDADLLAATGSEINFDPGAPLPPPPTVSVSPAAGLTDGQMITVSGTGFSPDATVGMSQCQAGATDSSDCASAFATASTDADGNFSAQLVVHTQLVVAGVSGGAPPGPDKAAGGPTGTTVDCTAAPGACVVGAANLADTTETATAPLDFPGPAGPGGPSITSSSGQPVGAGRAAIGPLLPTDIDALLFGIAFLGANRIGQVIRRLEHSVG